MKLKAWFSLAIVVSLVFINAGLVFSAEEPAPLASAPEIQNTQDLQWAWAEVVLVDSANNQIKVKYLDYETDTEKEMTVTVNDKTTFENVKDINEIRRTDTLSIDYVIDAEGKNLAKNINVEKTEGIQPAAEEPAKIPPKEELNIEPEMTPNPEPPSLERELKPAQNTAVETEAQGDETQP